MGFHSGPAMGVVAGNNIPNYCIMSDTGNLARLVYCFLHFCLQMVLICRVMEKMGEGMRIHISSISKELLDMVAFKRIHQNIFSLNKMPFLDQVGGFRCDYRGALDLGVTSRSSQNLSSQS